MPSNIVVTGLNEVIARLKEQDRKVREGTKVALNAALLILWQNVPPYPKKPENSKYRRTGTLGRTLGSGESGGASSGTPSIYQVREMGNANYEAHFGTNKDYAPYVIGDEDQAWMHKDRWWQMKNIVEKAQARITSIFKLLETKVKAYLEGNEL